MRLLLRPLHRTHRRQIHRLNPIPEDTWTWGADSDYAYREFVLGQTPSSGEEITLEYDAVHAWLDDDGDTCTIIDEYLESILLYLHWTTFQELASAESADPDPESSALSVLELNAYRAERAYRTTLKDYQRMSARSATATWPMDKWDRTY